MVQNSLWNDEAATQKQCVTALWDGESSVAGMVVNPVEVSVDNASASYDVWLGPNTGFSTITYRRTQNVVSQLDLDLRPFITDAFGRANLKAEWYLLGVEAGFELGQAGSPFTSNAYEVRIE